MKCPCGKEVMLVVLCGCWNMHVNEYAFCEDHVSPVVVGPCPEDGCTYCELRIKYLHDGFETVVPIARMEGSQVIQFTANYVRHRV